jgi:DNA polymerase-3 subunit alpha
MIVPIHNHTEYSALDGLATPREIAARCVEIGCPCCGITDHGTVAGHLEFGKEMQKNGIKPIYGCEFYQAVRTTIGKGQRDTYHFVVGAMTDEGLKNLWRLQDSTADAENFRHKARITWDNMERFAEGVFATSACIASGFDQAILAQDDESKYHGWDPYKILNRYLDIYGDNFYIEIHTYPGEEHERLNHTKIEIAYERGIPLIYATDAHAAAPTDYEVYNAYVAMQWGDSIYTPKDKRKAWHPNVLFIQDEAQVRQSLSYLPEWAVDQAIKNSVELGEKCNAEIPEIRRHLPAFIPAECPWLEFAHDGRDLKQMNAAQLFIYLIEQGITERYGENPPEEVWDRVVREMEVYLDADVGIEDPGGLAHYFLQAWDFCQYCDKEGIRRGPGRGSAAGSIVSYLLRITDVDPIHYDLIFERFYNPGRAKGFPDIDNDFPTKHRKKLRDKYMPERWGHKRVKSIGTVTRLKPLGAIDKTYKPCAVTWDEKEALKKIVGRVPDINILGIDQVGWAREREPGKTVYVLDSVGKDILEWVEGLPKDRWNIILKWLEILEAVCSRVSGYGIHPSGVVVADCDLDAELPCMWNNNEKVPVTCFPMEDVDNRQFVKQDFLGLRNLDTLEDWEGQKGEVKWSGMDLQEYPDELWELFDKGHTLGLFQIEDGYARRICKEFKPRSVEDLGIIVALNRPGPIRSGAVDSFITRRRGGTDDKFDGRKIPVLADLLEPTYGWFLYQEQVIRFFPKIGYSLSDADAIRKILGKKKPEAWKAVYHGEGEWEGKGFMEMAAKADLGDLRESVAANWDGAEEYPQVAMVAGIIWRMIVDFAKYSFNKSHAIAYGAMLFRTAYAKWQGTPEYTMSCIRTNDEKAGDYVSEARRMDIRVEAPDILLSEPEIAVKDNHIYFGFSNIKGVGKGSARYVCDLRENGWEDVDADEDSESLFVDFSQTIALGGPEALYEGLQARQWWYEQERDYCKRNGLAMPKAKSPGQQLNNNHIQALWDAGAWQNYIDNPMRLAQRQALEKELLGVILTDNCEELFAQHHEQVEACDSYADLEDYEEAQFVLPGVVSVIRPTETKKDKKPMGIVTIEYQGEQVEFVVFSKQWLDYRFLWKERTAGIFTLNKNERGVRFEKAIRL